MPSGKMSRVFDFLVPYILWGGIRLLGGHYSHDRIGNTTLKMSGRQIGGNHPVKWVQTRLAGFWRHMVKFFHRPPDLECCVIPGGVHPRHPIRIASPTGTVRVYLECEGT